MKLGTLVGTIALALAAAFAFVLLKRQSVTVTATTAAASGTGTPLPSYPGNTTAQTIQAATGLASQLGDTLSGWFGSGE